MGATWKRGKKMQSQKVRDKKGRVMERLQLQLKNGKKIGKNLVNPHLSLEETMIPLTDKDKIRIAKEIAVLETRI